MRHHRGDEVRHVPRSTHRSLNLIQSAKLKHEHNGILERTCVAVNMPPTLTSGAGRSSMHLFAARVAESGAVDENALAFMVR